jgi:hypothetical protein
MIDIEIDKLTNSIENTATGSSFPTLVLPLEKADLLMISKRKGWLFDWTSEFNSKESTVYKLTIVEEHHIIQGLISLEDKKDHIFMHLIENATFNKGKGRQFIGVAGNLVAFACKLSFEKGYDGFISFISKTALKNHYQETLGAKVLFGDTMVIENDAAQILVEKYFKTI